MYQFLQVLTLRFAQPLNFTRLLFYAQRQCPYLFGSYLIPAVHGLLHNADVKGVNVYKTRQDKTMFIEKRPRAF